ncbi:hypothetical protein [Bacillus clarus]|nr:hypothetical protein [Bacillus clarus]
MAGLLAASALGLGISVEPASVAENYWSLYGTAQAHAGVHVSSAGTVSFNATSPGVIRYHGYGSIVLDEGAFDGGRVTGTLSANAKTISTAKTDTYTWNNETRTVTATGNGQLVVDAEYIGSTSAIGYVSSAEMFVEGTVNYNNGAFYEKIVAKGDRGL